MILQNKNPAYIFVLSFFFLTLYNITIFTDHRFIPANRLILLIGLFSLNKDIFIIIRSSSIIISIIIIINDEMIYERNFCNCVKKPEKFRTSTRFEPGATL